MRKRGVVQLVATVVFSAALAAQEPPRPAAPSQAPPGVQFGRVTTAASVRGYRDFVARDQFTPGERVWVYAEALGVARNRQVDLVFHFVVTGPAGAVLYETDVEFNEPTTSLHWGAWRSFVLPARSALGTCTLRTEVHNRATGERGTREFAFKVVSAATALSAAVPPPRDPDEPGAGEPMSPEMEEAFGLLAQRQYDQATRVFRRALGKDKTSARGWWGLARAYEGLVAYKNVMDACDKLLECSRLPRYVAIAHNMKGAAFFTRAQEREPASKDDLAAARREFAEALAADASFHIARYNMGMVFLKEGNDEAGVTELKGYIAVAPASSGAREAARMIENPRRAREEFAPEFAIRTVDGELVDLDALKGKVVVIDFWASWCEPCTRAIPLLKTMRKRFAADRVEMISISVDSDAGAWRTALQRERMPWAQALDSSGRVARLFGVRPIPSTFVLDAEGIIRKRIVGYSSSFGSALDEAIKKALKATGGSSTTR